MLDTTRLRHIHRTSALALAVFLVVHLVNHLVALAGIEAHREFMAAARRVYRHPVGETLLLVAVVVQLVTGALQLRAGWGRRSEFWPRLQAVSGGYLLLFLTLHPMAILAIRGYFGLDSDFYAAASVLLVWPLPLVYAPYYALGVAAALAHVACAVRKWPEPASVGRQRAALSLLLAGPLVAVLIVATFAGAIFDIALPQPYRDMYSFLLW